MFDNIGYHFSNLDELLHFVEWLTSNFEKPEDFEEYLYEKMPFLEEADESIVSTTIFDAIALIDDYEGITYDEDNSDLVTDAHFWDMINHEYHHKGKNDTAIPGAD